MLIFKKERKWERRNKGEEEKILSSVIIACSACVSNIKRFHSTTTLMKKLLSLNLRIILPLLHSAVHFPSSGLHGEGRKWNLFYSHLWKIPHTHCDCNKACFMTGIQNSLSLCLNIYVIRTHGKSGMISLGQEMRLA